MERCTAVEAGGGGAVAGAAGAVFGVWLRRARVGAGWNFGTFAEGDRAEET